MSWSADAFREKLENEYTFPVVYRFKFIVPMGKKEELEALLPDGDLSFRPSKNNTYVSLTLKRKVQSSDEVISVYTDVHQIEGILSL